MKIAHDGSKSNSGSALVYTLVVGGLLGMAVASFLDLVNAQYKSVKRSQNWNAAIPVIEAGVEEALAQLHFGDITNLATNGWSYTWMGYTKERAMGDSKFVVSIIPVNPPIITSRGYVRQPLSTERCNKVGSTSSSVRRSRW